MQPLNVCVLGGTGFVGTELVRRLVQEQYWVRVPTRVLSHGDTLRVFDTVELCIANIHDAHTLEDLFYGMDVVINLVGILNEDWRTGFQEVHAQLPARVVAAAHARGVRRLLHMSAIGASPRAPSRYLRSKAAGEAAVHAAPSDVRVTIFRPSVIFGQGDSLTNRFARMLRVTRDLVPLPLARSQARFAPIHVLDVVDAFLRALHRRDSHGQTYELCGPQVLTLEQIVRLTAEVAELPAWIVPIPDSLARIQGRLMELLPSKPFTRDNLRSLSIDAVCRDNGCARLGLVPREMLSVLPTYLGPSKDSKATHMW